MSNWDMYNHIAKDAKKYFYKVFPVLEPGYWTSDYDETKYNAYLFFSQIRPFSYHINYEVGKAQNQMYMSRYGLDYFDINNPWNLPGSTRISGAYSGTLNFVSDNVKRLYK